MLIEIHMIQNHSPANLNRDDLGAPKTCIFGGVTRARISSQCLKRSIRRSQEFAEALEKDGGVRTRRLATKIVEASDGKSTEAKILKVFDECGVKTHKDGDKFDILFFLPQSAINEMGEAVKANKPDLGKEFADITKKFVQTPDIALCGRMTEFAATGAFKDLAGKLTVEAALSAAHALSTHAVTNEVDYFTAADDVPGPDAGAAHPGEALFNSACFYKHFAIDFDQLKKNLGGNDDLAKKTVKCFLEGAAKANPSGKQHSFAAFNCPDAILVEVKQSNKPVSYANAFADPVVPEKSERGLVGESVAKLAAYANDLITGYGIEATRFFFSPNGRFKLEPTIEGLKVDGKFDDFVTAVMKAVKAPAEAR
ncbi:MAG: type I-E CRISPR-associated protein Cas7/Cse4/CasC [Planctomycetota bacterium]|nr:type I-E CRISPR-associated protein Cas7/Cse4/CasC [Planctomycetota bacterium]